MNLVVDDITELLKRSEAGDSQAARQLLERIYADLRQIARARLRHEQADTLGTTALVHETWLSMARHQQASFGSRQHYFAYAAKAMRHILIDRARQRAAEKRLPGFNEQQPYQQEDSLDLIALDQALTRLATLSARIARVVELRLFAGLSSGEISSILGLTERTIERDWLKGRALLGQWLEAAP
jgi:RNA polymerase sigma factor (TIGR02999 family)